MKIEFRASTKQNKSSVSFTVVIVPLKLDKGVLGTCTHIAPILWYLEYARHQQYNDNHEEKKTEKKTGR